MSACRSCHARIVWAKSVTGKALPLNAQPVLGGNIELRKGVAHYLSPNPEVRRYVAHFVTCPDAAQHRKAKP